MSLKNVKIREVNRLRLKAPEKYKQSKKPQMLSIGVLPEPEFLTPLEDEKPDFIKILTELFALELISINGIELTPNELYYFDERAGIYEFYGGLSRGEAEDRVLKEIQKFKNFIN